MPNQKMPKNISLKKLSLSKKLPKKIKGKVKKCLNRKK